MILYTTSSFGWKTNLNKEKGTSDIGCRTFSEKKKWKTLKAKSVKQRNEEKWVWSVWLTIVVGDEEENRKLFKARIFLFSLSSEDFSNNSNWFLFCDTSKREWERELSGSGFCKWVILTRLKLNRVISSDGYLNTRIFSSPCSRFAASSSFNFLDLLSSLNYQRTKRYCFSRI